MPHIWWVDLNQTHTYGGRNNVWKQWKYLVPTLKQLVRGSSPRSVTTRNGIIREDGPVFVMFCASPL